MTLGEIIKKLKDLTDEDFEGNKKEIVALIKEIEVPELVYEEQQGDIVLEMPVSQRRWD